MIGYMPMCRRGSHKLVHTMLHAPLVGMLASSNAGFAQPAPTQLPASLHSQHAGMAAYLGCSMSATCLLAAGWIICSATRVLLPVVVCCSPPVPYPLSESV